MEFFDKILDHVSDELTDGEGGESGGGGGWEDAIGGFIDRFSGGDGGGDGDSPLSGLTDRLGSFLPDGIRDQAESWLRGDGEGGSSWAGSLTDTLSNALPSGWESVASTVAGHAFGEGGWNALADRGLNLLRDTDPAETGAPPFASSAPDGATPSRYDFDGPDVVNGPIHSPGITHELDDGAGRAGATDAGGASGMPDDPTFFPADAPAVVSHPLEAPAPVEPEPMDDFQQAINDADAMEDSFDSMVEDLA